jgi:hypothetical protein
MSEYEEAVKRYWQEKLKDCYRILSQRPLFCMDCPREWTQSSTVRSPVLWALPHPSDGPQSRSGFGGVEENIRPQPRPSIPPVNFDWTALLVTRCTSFFRLNKGGQNSQNFHNAKRSDVSEASSAEERRQWNVTKQRIMGSVARKPQRSDWKNHRNVLHCSSETRHLMTDTSRVIKGWFPFIYNILIRNRTLPCGICQRTEIPFKYLQASV